VTNTLRVAGRDYAGIAAILLAAATGDLPRGVHSVWGPLPAGEFICTAVIHANGSVILQGLEPWE
jgi:hypothetical protein